MTNPNEHASAQDRHGVASLDAVLDALTALVERPANATALRPAVRRAAMSHGFIRAHEHAGRQRIDLTKLGLKILRASRPYVHPVPGWELEARLCRELAGWPVRMPQDTRGFAVVCDTPFGPRALRAKDGTDQLPSFQPSRDHLDANRLVAVAKRRQGIARVTIDTSAFPARACLHRAGHLYEGESAYGPADAVCQALMTFLILDDMSLDNPAADQPAHANSRT